MTPQRKELVKKIFSIIGLVLFFIVVLIGPSLIVFLLVTSKGTLLPFLAKKGGVLVIRFLPGLLVYGLGITFLFLKRPLYAKVFFWYGIVAGVAGLIGALVTGVHVGSV